MLMEEKEQELNEMQEQMLDKADKMDQLLKQAARVLAAEHQLCDYGFPLP